MEKKGKKVLPFDSRFRENPSNTSGSLERFRLNQGTNFNGQIQLEQFGFQNSQDRFSPQNDNNQFTLGKEGVTCEKDLRGPFLEMDRFLKAFHTLVADVQVTMTFDPILSELQVASPSAFDLPREGHFLPTIGFRKQNLGQLSSPHGNIPKKFLQSPISVQRQEFGTSSTSVQGSPPFNFPILPQSGFEINRTH